ncbi:MAG: uroporphyrinogen decarboxylase family protein [Bacteroidota bacterium]
MTSKERLMTALNKEKPDRLPVTIHQWQGYHLDKYLGGISDLEACKEVGFDAQIQYFEEMAQFWVTDADFTKLNTSTWKDIPKIIDDNPDHRIIHHTIETPEGNLTYKTSGDRKTTWITEYLIKKDEDINLIKNYMPVPNLNLAPIEKKYDEVGDDGILRGFVWGDQAGCWQHAACLYDITDLIMATFEKPDWVHELLEILLDKKLQFIESMKGAKFDLIETGGGSSSSTVISPDMHKEYCLPYDRKMHDALHDLNFKSTYHTCGGTLGLEEFIVQNNCDASETLAPISIGSNQEPALFAEKINNRVALIGGVDQFSVVSDGDRDLIQATINNLFNTVGKNGGYICSLSDHFFETPVQKLKWFAEAAHECVY